jgi:hypothetical protein
MATQHFHRHTRRCLDAAVRRILTSTSLARREAFARLVSVVHARSDLMRRPPDARGELPHLGALLNLSRFHRESIADAYAWTGASGHPLVVVHSLANHLLGPYPTPRFLGSVWFGTNTIAERGRRNWFIQHARGRPFRSLSLPMPMTRGMEHVFLKSPDHLDVDRAMRRAEVMGLGGDPELAEAVLATRLGQSYDDTAGRRALITWLVRWRDELDLAQVGPIVDYLAVTRDPRPLHERTLSAMWRDVDAWRTVARRPQPQPRPGSRRPAVARTWSPSRWNGLVVADAPGVSWQIVELLDRAGLADEGRTMRHCVGSYAARCARGDSAIWSLRRSEGRAVTSILTIEVSPRTGAIVQLRAAYNRAAWGPPLDLVRAWAAREQLAFTAEVEWHIAHAPRS